MFGFHQLAAQRKYFGVNFETDLLGIPLSEIRQVANKHKSMSAAWSDAWGNSVISLAWHNLMHDRVRLAVTLTGIVFSRVLILVQFGLFLGFLETSGNIVERSGADLWITAPGIPHVNAGAPIPERRRFQALAIKGVARADKFILQFNPWKLPSGAWENVQVAGFDLQGGMGGPWNLTTKNAEGLHARDSVIVDELYRQKLGIQQDNALFELNNKRGPRCRIHTRHPLLHYFALHLHIAGQRLSLPTSPVRSNDIPADSHAPRR